MQNMLVLAMANRVNHKQIPRNSKRNENEDSATMDLRFMSLVWIFYTKEIELVFG